MAATSTNQTLRQYYALSGVQLDFDSFDLGHGVVLSQTYLHVMSPPLIAFAPCSESKPHPTPWRTANVKPRHMEADLFAQLSVPRSYGSNEHYEWASWIVLLLRFANDVTVTLTLTASDTFNEVKEGKAAAYLLEDVPYIFEGTTIHQDEAEWLKANWHKSLPLRTDDTLSFALTSIYNSHRANEEFGVVSVWAALERLFSSNAVELKYRVCSNIAAFLEPPGQTRYLLFQQLSKLYDDRSKAAHGSPMKSATPYMDISSIASRAVLRIIELGRVPTKDDLERELFAPIYRSH